MKLLHSTTYHLHCIQVASRVHRTKGAATENNALIALICLIFKLHGVVSRCDRVITVLQLRHKGVEYPAGVLRRKHNLKVIMSSKSI